jgi:hypothetical protein
VYPSDVEVDVGHPASVRLGFQPHEVVGGGLDSHALQVPVAPRRQSDTGLEVTVADPLNVEPAEHRVTRLVEVQQFVEPRDQ